MGGSSPYKLAIHSSWLKRMAGSSCSKRRAKVVFPAPIYPWIKCAVAILLSGDRCAFRGRDHSAAKCDGACALSTKSRVAITARRLHELQERTITSLHKADAE